MATPRPTGDCGQKAPSVLCSHVGAVLAAARAEGVREMARRLGCYHQSLHRLEQGRANPTVGRLKKVAACYGGRLEVRFVRAGHKASFRPLDDHGGVLASALGDQNRAALARELGVSPVALVRLEQGRANPTLERLEEVAALYGGRLEVRFVRHPVELV